MTPIMIGQRVRVIDRHLVHYRQAGAVVALHPSEGYYVHLDYDDDRPDARIFFHAEELELADEPAPHGRPDNNVGPADSSAPDIGAFGG